MISKLISEIVKDKSINKVEKLLMVYFVSNMDEKESITITISSVCSDLVMTKPTFTKAVKGLIEARLVEKDNNFNNGIITANTYRMNLFKYKCSM